MGAGQARGRIARAGQVLLDDDAGRQVWWQADTRPGSLDVRVGRTPDEDRFSGHRHGVGIRCEAAGTGTDVRAQRA